MNILSNIRNIFKKENVYHVNISIMLWFQTLNMLVPITSWYRHFSVITESVISISVRDKEKSHDQIEQMSHYTGKERS